MRSLGKKRSESSGCPAHCDQRKGERFFSLKVETLVVENLVGSGVTNGVEKPVTEGTEITVKLGFAWQLKPGE